MVTFEKVQAWLNIQANEKLASLTKGHCQTVSPTVTAASTTEFKLSTIYFFLPFINLLDQELVFSSHSNLISINFSLN